VGLFIVPHISDIKKKNNEVMTTAETLDEIYALYETQKSPKFNWWGQKKQKKQLYNDEPMFKIKAYMDYRDDTGDFLSFRKNQEYYVLNANNVTGVYHVATSRSMPFSMTSISGKVPMFYFMKV
jgi:hypothetical protein